MLRTKAQRTLSFFFVFFVPPCETKMKKVYKCRFCGEAVDKDTAALNKKLINRTMPVNLMVCLQCMAETLDCEVEDLRDKIEEYKNEGCTLFG